MELGQDLLQQERMDADLQPLRSLVQHHIGILVPLLDLLFRRLRDATSELLWKKTS
jgi:hypothetical protein